MAKKNIKKSAFEGARREPARHKRCEKRVFITTEKWRGVAHVLLCVCVCACVCVRSSPDRHDSWWGRCVRCSVSSPYSRRLLRVLSLDLFSLLGTLSRRARALLRLRCGVFWGWILAGSFVVWNLSLDPQSREADKESQFLTAFSPQLTIFAVGRKLWLSD